MGKKKAAKKFTPEEKQRAKKYRLLLTVPIALNIALLFSGDLLAAKIIDFFSDVNYLYIYAELSIPFILFFIFGLTCFVLLVDLYTSAGKGISSFTDFFHRKIIRI